MNEKKLALYEIIIVQQDTYKPIHSSIVLACNDLEALHEAEWKHDDWFPVNKNTQTLITRYLGTVESFTEPEALT